MAYSFDVKDGKLINVQYGGGGFSCFGKKLTSLEGCPSSVEGNFDCSFNQLTSLEDCPQEIGGRFFCIKNKLKDLKGAPKEVRGAFNCSYNQLTSLEGGPEKTDMYDCSGNQLTSLKGGGPKVTAVLNCSDNPNLEDISDLPSTCSRISVKHCSKIRKFPEKIETELCFICPTGWVRRRIKEVLTYEVVEENEESITVRQKMIGQQLLDVL